MSCDGVDSCDQQLHHHHHYVYYYCYYYYCYYYYYYCTSKSEKSSWDFPTPADRALAHPLACLPSIHPSSRSKEGGRRRLPSSSSPINR